MRLYCFVIIAAAAAVAGVVVTVAVIVANVNAKRGHALKRRRIAQNPHNRKNTDSTTSFLFFLFAATNPIPSRGIRSKHIRTLFDCLPLVFWRQTWAKGTRGQG